jgi:tetrahydromethanopterin S-methyltransferase subunit A
MTSDAPAWPVLPGTYEVGDPQAPVAVCALTSQRLVAPLAQLPGVAIAGTVYTANHGIERIVINVTTNPSIRFLLLCGKEAALFRPGQSLVALAERGMDAERRIAGALGYEPVLPTVAPERVAQFLRQVELVDWTGEEDQAALEERIRGLAARSPGRFVGSVEGALPAPEEQGERFIAIRPGGQREPLQYDPKGYFVISLDREADQIILRHYLPDHSPAHEMRGRSVGPMLLGLLREGLVSQLSHAGYLGEELAKAQVALQLGLRYDQDRPIRPAETFDTATQDARGRQEPQAEPARESAPATAMPPSRMPPVQPALTSSQLEATAAGTLVDVAIAVTKQPTPDTLAGTVLEPDAAEPFNVYHRTQQLVRIRWSPATRIVMGDASDLRIGALVRVRATLGDDRALDEAQSLVILSRVARIVE